jgi:hypothetical protein
VAYLVKPQNPKKTLVKPLKNPAKAPAVHTNCVIRLGSKRVRSQYAEGENPVWEIDNLEVYVLRESTSDFSVQ